MPERASGISSFEHYAPHKDAEAGGLPTPNKISSLEDIPKQEWHELSPEALLELFPHEEQLVQRLFPVDLLGRKRTVLAVESAMQKPLAYVKEVRRDSHLLGNLYNQGVKTIRDFFALQFTDQEFGILMQQESALIEGVSTAFARPLLVLPHTRLIQTIIGQNGYETPHVPLPIY